MSAAAIWKGSASVQFRATTGRLTLSDRILITDVYGGPYTACLAAALIRGAFGSGARAGFVIATCIVEQTRGNEGTLTYNWEAGGPSAVSYPPPPDEFSIEPEELSRRIEYASFLTDPATGLPLLTYANFTLAESTVRQPTPQARAKALDSVNNIPDLTQRALAQKLSTKLIQGQETYTLVIWHYRWTTYHYIISTIINPGGKTETPTGPLASILPDGMQWLRQADFVTHSGVNGSALKITKSWLGAPQGHWDSDLYPAA